MLNFYFYKMGPGSRLTPTFIVEPLLNSKPDAESSASGFFCLDYWVTMRYSMLETLPFCSRIISWVSWLV